MSKKIVLSFHFNRYIITKRLADVAQSVEHFIGNEEVHEFDSHHQLQNMRKFIWQNHLDFHFFKKE